MSEAVEFIYCACGCGKTRAKYNKQRKLRKYIDKHGRIGLKHSPESLKKISESRKGKLLGENIISGKEIRLQLWKVCITG